MKIFETKVQQLKYKVLLEVAKSAWQDTLLEDVPEIPERIVPGKIPTMRCCVYKERAILNERVKLAIGGNRYNKKVIKVIDIACDDCPAGGFEVTPACRGCLAHRCEQACKRQAITFGADQKAHIDKTKCVDCGMCEQACPYHAIINYKRPCEASCKVKAISMGQDKQATIDYDKCIACGSCVYMCPFGAISDRSYILDVIDLIKKNEDTHGHVYALVAPSIASQFTYAKLGQIFTAIKEIGFTDIVEVALGADLVSMDESIELEEKGFLTSSCCPAFVSFIEKNFPNLKEHISSNLSPAGTIARKIKEQDPQGKIVFIGPCMAKKYEFQREEYANLMDSVITFEELQALIDSKNIDVENLSETKLEQASYFGRIFGRSGGLSEAVAKAIQERGSDFHVEPLVCNGIDECRAALLKAGKGILHENFIEGMACLNGCIGGAGCLTHESKSTSIIDRYGKDALHQSISSAIEES